MNNDGALCDHDILQECGFIFIEFGLLAAGINGHRLLVIRLFCLSRDGEQSSNNPRLAWLKVSGMALFQNLVAFSLEIGASRHLAHDNPGYR